MTPSRTIVFGVAIGLPAAFEQLWLIHLNSPQATLFRSILSMTAAIVVGVLAGLWGKTEAVKVAALMGFILGVLLSSSGLASLATDTNMIGQHPFSSAETALAFVSSVLAGTAIGSWIIACFSVLVALAIRSAQMKHVGPSPR
jgi:hypothetical protein